MAASSSPVFLSWAGCALKCDKHWFYDSVFLGREGSSWPSLIISMECVGGVKGNALMKKMTIFYFTRLRTRFSETLDS